MAIKALSKLSSPCPYATDLMSETVKRRSCFVRLAANLSAEPAPATAATKAMAASTAATASQLALKIRESHVRESEDGLMLCAPLSNPLENIRIGGKLGSNLCHILRR